MRLLHCKSLSFRAYLGEDVPRYAILSHRWLEDTSQEVTFQDMSAGNIRNKSGYCKIEYCARQASLDGIDYFWIDTCCIDKSSSAELSEAINSMYRWYKNAEICYVFLSDVSSNEQKHAVFPTVRTFETSNWFSRGWTLQELIAPMNVTFYSQEWIDIGTKTQLLQYIEAITGIDTSALAGKDPSAFSVAQRMSWAAKRITTRIEDMAYSLLGIFDVNMPLLYGEGNKAFIRLQEEIMKASNDQSIFAWKSEPSVSEIYTGLLARSPSYFIDSGNIQSLGFWGEGEPCSVTSRGLYTKLYMSTNYKERGTYHALLECAANGNNNLKPTIVLQLVSNFEYGSQYVRIRADDLQILDSKLVKQGGHKAIYVRQNIDQLLLPSRLVIGINQPIGFDLFWIRSTSDFCVDNAIPPDQWNNQSRLFSLAPGHIGRLLITHSAGKQGSTTTSLSFVIAEGIPVCLLHDPSIVPNCPSLRKDSGFGTSVQSILRKTARGGTLFGTARTGREEICGRIVYTIILFIKTIP